MKALRVVFAAVGLLGADFAALAEGSASEWDKSCYEGFDAIVISISGTTAKNCGFVADRASTQKREDAIACARKSLSGSEPFRVGYEGYGDDSAFCDVAIRTADGELISIWVDHDVMGGGRRDGVNRAMKVSRCGELAFQPSTIYEPGFLDMKRCRAAPDLSADANHLGPTP